MKLNNIIRSFFLGWTFMLIILSPAMAQDAATADSFMSDPFNHPMLTFYLIMAFIFIVFVLVLVVVIYMLKVLNMFVQKAAEERAEKLGIPFVPEPSWWQKMDRSLTGAVPLEKEETVMLDHNYDGIRELDNHLPPWWKWLFYFTIVWAGVYLVVYHITDTLPLQAEEFDQQMADASKMKATGGAVIDENTVQLTTDGAVLQSGKDIFISNCASCHKADGGGMIGPNLTDAYWIHGGSIKDVFRTITNGIPNTNMIPWKGSLSPEKVRDVSNYVMSLQGTNPEGAKEPQGELYTPDASTPAATDSTEVGAVSAQ